MLRFSAFNLLLLVSTFFAPLTTKTVFAVDNQPASSDGLKFTDADWPWWRGPNYNGVAAPNQRPPVEWSDSKNVRWKAPVLGKGHSSPTVVGQRVFLATADEDQKVQAILCFDRRSGKQLWKADVHVGNFIKPGNAKSSQASSTVGCDGSRVFINFINSDAVFTTALDLDGKQLWQTKITDYVLHQGYGASPIPYGPLVIVMADNKGGGAIAGLERSTGKIVWRHDRPKLPNYPSPVVLNVAGRSQLLLTGCDLVSSWEPLTGKKLWEIAGATTECVTSTVTDGKLIFTSGGYPKNHMSAVRADGSGEVVWENTDRVYVPSMLVRDGHLYFVTDAGVAMCRRCDTGKAVWSERLGGTFSSSPVLVGERLYATNEAGTTFIWKATPTGFEKLGENQLGDEIFATPTFCNHQIFMRVAATVNDKRQETLYCLGEVQ